MERLTDESAKKRRQLDHETTETLTAQIELDKTAEDFRKAHQERQELIRQWENTIEQMQRRDKEMDLLAAVSSQTVRHRDIQTFIYHMTSLLFSGIMSCHKNRVAKLYIFGGTKAVCLDSAMFSAKINSTLSATKLCFKQSYDKQNLT